MSFVSLEFVLLLVSVLGFLAISRSRIWRKVILLFASCVFYAYWDWRFLGLLALITCLDYYISHLLAFHSEARTRQSLLAFSVVTNLGFLSFFKYSNFFLDTLNLAFAPLGVPVEDLNIILPIGISFYTFETLSYVIDVYRGVAKPARSLLDYAIFITFFPRLVSGPIMRARQFLPQLERGIQLNADNLTAGAQLFLRGMFKKLVLADNMALFVDRVYAAPSLYSSSTVWLAVFAYSVQIYFDFSGYTDMALGIAKMLGIDLPRNFNLPYTAQSITEFWQRWHISLSSWLKDYLYIPLGGNRRGHWRTYLNLMLTMLLGGLWHGASWNFVMWGGLHGLGLASERWVLGEKQVADSFLSWRAWVRATCVFVVVSLAWVFFRSHSPQTISEMFAKLLNISPGGLEWTYTPAIIVVPLTMVAGLVSRTIHFEIPIFTWRQSYAIPLFSLVVLLIYYLSPLYISPFIYFQF